MTNLIYQSEIETGTDRVPYLEVLIKSVFDYSIKTKSAYIFNKDLYLEKSNTNKFVDKFYTSLDIIYDPYFDKYDDILYLDTDIYISKKAKNIFDIKKDPDTDLLASSVLYYQQTYTSYEKDSNFLNSKLVPSSRYPHPRYINTGVMLFTKKGRMKARDAWDDWHQLKSKFGKEFIDEIYINHMINKYNFSVYELTSAWNFVFNLKSASGLDPHFYHFFRYKKLFIEEFLKKIGEIPK